VRAWRGSWPKPFRYFSVFLIVTLAVELFATWWKLSLHSTSYWNYKQSNLWIYNLYLLPQYLFYLYYFHETLISGRIKRNIKITTVVYATITITNYLWGQKLHTLFNTYTVMAACLMISVLCIVFFFQVSNSVNILKPGSSPEIWIVSGMFIFHFCALPCFIFSNYLTVKYPTLAYNIFIYVLQFFNIIMYSFYLIAFLCKPHFQK
ncbi:MAG: hypothetical protein WCF67_23055, partial [Chitinophagaceae bacterium]